MKFSILFRQSHQKGQWRLQERKYSRHPAPQTGPSQDYFVSITIYDLGTIDSQKAGHGGDIEGLELHV